MELVLLPQSHELAAQMDIVSPKKELTGKKPLGSGHLINQDAVTKDTNKEGSVGTLLNIKDFEKTEKYLGMTHKDRVDQARNVLSLIVPMYVCYDFAYSNYRIDNLDVKILQALRTDLGKYVTPVPEYTIKTIVYSVNILRARLEGICYNFYIFLLLKYPVKDQAIGSENQSGSKILQ